MLHVRENPKISEMPFCKSRFPNEQHRLHSHRCSCSNKTPPSKADNRPAGQEFPRILQTKWFIFRRVRKIAKSDYKPRHVCLSVCPHGTARLPLNAPQGYVMRILPDLLHSQEPEIGPYEPNARSPYYYPVVKNIQRYACTIS